MESGQASSHSMHIAMYPWLALGHITPNLQYANKLARKGHRVSLLVPTKTQSKIKHLNKFPDLINFVPITVPHVDGLPPGAETTTDVAAHQYALIMTAMDRTEPTVETILRGLKPDVVFFDLAHWIPNLARSLGFKSVYFTIMSPMCIAYLSADRSTGSLSPEQRLLEPPPGFPDPSIKLRRHEVPYFSGLGSRVFGEKGSLSIPERAHKGINESDAYASKGCREIDGAFFDFLKEQNGWDVIPVGPILPEPACGDNDGLDPKWNAFLSRFEHGSVVYCGLGSEAILSIGQFQELVTGLELSGHPFLAALKPPVGFETVEEALPEGFACERGAVFGGWIQQPLILTHPAVGFYVTHGGYGSMIEGIVGGCQLVMVPYKSDQIFNTRLICNRLRAGVEVNRDENDGSFTREGICRAIKAVSSKGEIRTNLDNLRELLLKGDLESTYVNAFTRILQALVAN